MTALENLMVAQHNKLMHASGYILGLIGAPGFRRAEAEAIERARTGSTASA
jgi:branched-chain amino acid transport system ATP-binding protein